jgi:mannose-6-phosphate isomerase
VTAGPSLTIGARTLKPWGSEEIWALVPDRYCAKFLRVNAGHRLSLQYHVHKDETMRLIEGEGYLLVGETLSQLERVELEPGVSAHIPAGWVHRLCAVTDIVVLEASTTELDDVVRMDDDYVR